MHEELQRQSSVSASTLDYLHVLPLLAGLSPLHPTRLEASQRGHQKRKGGDTNLKICGVGSIVLSVSRKDLPPSWNLRKALVEEPTTVAAHGPSNNVHV